MATSGKDESDRLRARGYDGLYAPDQPCGCYLDDLRPCGETHTGCRPGLALDTDEFSGVYRPAFVRLLRKQDKSADRRSEEA
jgi:hypothetical protein